MKYTGLIFMLCAGLVLFSGCASMEKELKAAKDQISKLERELEAARRSLEFARGELEQAKKAAETAQRDLDAARGDLSAAQKEIADLQAQLNKKPVTTGQERLIPINQEIINQMGRAKKDLGDLDYFISMPITLVMNKGNNDTQINSGRLAYREENVAEVIELKIENTGKLIGNGYAADPVGKESFEVSFPDKNAVLVFTKNPQLNRFDLSLAKSEGKDYVFHFDGAVPHLCIYYDYINPRSSMVRVQGLPIGSTSVTQPTLAPAPQPDSAQPSEPSSRPPVSTGPKVIDSGMLSKEEITAFIVSQNSSVNSRQAEVLADAYIAEAQKEQVNHDIAIAQMCYATRFMGNRDRMTNNNFAGFSAIDGVEVRYPDMESGVRAHIQHLKGYASKEPLKTPVVDRRFEILEQSGARGTVTTLDELCAKWAPNSKDYGARINDILKTMQQAASRR